MPWECPYCKRDFASHAPSGECPGERGELSPEGRRLGIELAEMFAKEKMEHPTFKDSQVWQIVSDHLAKMGKSAEAALTGLKAESEKAMGNPGEHTYRVYVGNIGAIQCKDFQEAVDTFREYESQSKSGYGRAMGEPVYLLIDDKIAKEYIPKESSEENPPRRADFKWTGYRSSPGHEVYQYFHKDRDKALGGISGGPPWIARVMSDSSIDGEGHSQNFKSRKQAMAFVEKWARPYEENPPRRAHQEKRPDRPKPFSARKPMSVVESPLVKYQRQREEAGQKTKLSKIGVWGTIPYSELAIHTKLAGETVVQYLLIYADYGKGRPTYAMVLTTGKAILDGTPGEVIPYEVTGEGVRGNPVSVKRYPMPKGRGYKSITIASEGDSMEEAEKRVESFAAHMKINKRAQKSDTSRSSAAFFNPDMTLIGRKVLSIEVNGTSMNGPRYGAAYGLKDGSAFIKGFFPNLPKGFVTAILYQDEAKAERMGLNPVTKPFKHDFSGLHVKARKCRGGILLKGDKPVWENR